MAITSVGYDGTVTEAQWAALSSYLGTPYAVAGPNDLAVSANGSATLTVNIAAGSAYGHGVLDTSNAQASVVLGAIGSGTRWDLIVLRRNWSGSTGTSTLVAVAGTATYVVPARNTTPGTLDDQPLALVQVTAGQNVPTAVVDLRVFASKVITAPTLLALPEAGRGTHAYVGPTHYRRDYDATLSLAWLGDVSSIGAGINLDTFVTTGVWQQATMANGTLALNYPIANSLGFLEVFAQPSGTTMITQRFTRTSAADPRVWVRTFYTSWSPWREVTPSDTGWIATGFTAATGFSLGGNLGYRIMDGVCHLRGQVTRSGATINAPSSGNITDTDFMTIPLAARPPYSVYASFKASFSNGALAVGTDGVCTLNSMNSNSPIGTGDLVSFQTTYVL